jgi:hypothetical protein
MVIAWISMISLELPWSWIKIVGPITLALLLLGPASLQMIRTVSGRPRDPACCLPEVTELNATTAP